MLLKTPPGGTESMLQLHPDFQRGESVPCIADTLPHPLISEQKAVQVSDSTDFMKSQRKIIPVVFTLHSTCAHVDTFFYGDEIF